jgi:hypothetical protein
MINFSSSKFHYPHQLTQRRKVCYPILTQPTKLLPLHPIKSTAHISIHLYLTYFKLEPRIFERRYNRPAKPGAGWARDGEWFSCRIGEDCSVMRNRKKKPSLGQGKEFGELKDRSQTTVTLDKVPSCLPRLELPGRWP